MQVLANLVVLTAIYALISCGYVLIYRVSRVLNLAHGELMMLGAYLLFTLASLFKGGPELAFAGAVGLSLLVGFVLYVVLMRKMTGELVIAAVLVTIALGILLRGLMVLIWTARDLHPISVLGWKNPPVPLGGGTSISSVALATILVAVVLYLALMLFFRYTRWGLQMRAVGERPLLAAQRGIKLHAVYALAWALSTFSGGLAGMLLALDSGLGSTMVIVGLKAFPAALVGGLDSLLGAVVGSFIVAAAEILAIHFIDPLISDVVPFVVLIAMLLVRPWGLFGTKEEIERV
ncbi:MAG: branched-chain amino acid ABC transporter permease [Rhodospirillales bacterium]|nr:branched-chain amino acid ABC transporter permease [Rhodospirillales bacterium]